VAATDAPAMTDAFRKSRRFISSCAFLQFEK
jgi:hypothetical protein